MFKFRWFLIIIAVLVVVVGSVFAFWPRVTVRAEGTIGISLTTNTPPQFDIVSISDIPAYGVIEPSGCGEFKGRVKIRIDCFLKPESPYYPQYGGAYVPDENSLEYLAGYPGKVDKETGEPLDWDDYNKWWDSLPTVWQDNPFHSHFVYYDTTVLDDSIKAEIAKVTEYFYAFHLYCWDNEYTFLSQWVKVPKQAGTIRDVFIAGDSSPPNKTACEDKADDIVSRTGDFDTRTFEESPFTPTDLNIGEKGTIDVGSLLVDGDSTAPLWHSVFSYRTYIDYNNAANASGTIDTVVTYTASATAGNIAKFGTFIDNGSASFTCHDAEQFGQLSLGINTCTNLSIDISTGEFIGADARAAVAVILERNLSGGSGVYYATGQFCDPSDTTTFTLQADDILSLYGTGTEAGGGFDIGNAPDTENLGTVEVNTTYYAYGSAPSNPVEDGECTFTVTNSGDACDLDMKISDFTGGVGWNIDATPEADEVKVTAYYSGQNPASGLVLANTDAEFYDGLASSATIKWDFSMLTGTSFSDGEEKSAQLVVTAVAED